jgi:pimeloyl-ACP methyl ester carboxylesterase
MAHGWAAVKEMNLDYVAAALCDVGVAALVYDHRGFGASEGLRGDADPHQQIADHRSAIDAAAGMADLDVGRLGVWGSSYSGGHVLCVAADDARVRAVVAQVPTISGGEATRRRHDAAGLAELRRRFAAERAALARGAPPTYVPAAVVTGGPPDPGREVLDPVAPHALPPAPEGVYADAERGRYYADLPAERRRTWRNRVTLSSFERYARYEPGERIADSPAPLLVITAAQDTITPTDLIDAAVARVRGAREIETLTVPGGHYALYTDHRERCARAAAAFFADRL